MEGQVCKRLLAALVRQMAHKP